MSLIANRAIGTKVTLGFACVLAILAIVSGQAYFAFDTSAAGFATYVQRVSVVGSPTRSTGASSIFAVSPATTRIPGPRATSRARRRRTRHCSSCCTQGLAEIKNPERHRLLEDIVRNFEAYSKDFDQLVMQTHEQKKLVEGTLDRWAPACRQISIQSFRRAVKAGNSSAGVLAYEGRQQLMLARLNVNKFLGRHEQGAAEAAEKSFVNLIAALQAARRRHQGRRIPQNAR